MQPKHPAPEDPDLAELLAHLCQSWDGERRALARQMHDQLGSALTALSMHLGQLTRQLPPDAALQERAAQMKQVLAQVVQTNRGLQDQLWNDKLDYLGLKPALQDLAERFQAQFPAPALMLCLPDGDAECPVEHALTLWRCADEGLHNAMRHARARSIGLVLEDLGDALHLSVRDDGVGMHGARPGLGLRLLRERVRQAGGVLQLSAGPEGGSILSVRLPRVAGGA